MLTNLIKFSFGLFIARATVDKTVLSQAPSWGWVGGTTLLDLSSIIFIMITKNVSAFFILIT